MESAQGSAGPSVLIVAPDERWGRVLEITVRLGGYRPVSRRSTEDALRVRKGEEPPIAIVFDLGDRWSAEELEAVRGLLTTSSIPAVVILPRRLAEERERIAGVGATVLSRPYAPSALYAALPPIGDQPPSSPPAPSTPAKRARSVAKAAVAPAASEPSEDIPGSGTGPAGSGATEDG